jgi:hypothetical protein
MSMMFDKEREISIFEACLIVPFAFPKFWCFRGPMAGLMSIFIKIDISRASIIRHLKKKISNIINVEQKPGDCVI